MGTGHFLFGFQHLTLSSILNTHTLHFTKSVTPLTSNTAKYATEMTQFVVSFLECTKITNDQLQVPVCDSKSSNYSRRLRQYWYNMQEWVSRKYWPFRNEFAIVQRRRRRRRRRRRKPTLVWTRIYSRQNKDPMNGYGLINKFAAIRWWAHLHIAGKENKKHKFILTQANGKLCLANYNADVKHTLIRV